MKGNDLKKGLENLKKKWSKISQNYKNKCLVFINKNEAFLSYKILWEIN